MIAYKLKWLSLEKDKMWFNILKVKLVERFVDGKHDKFIPIEEAIKFLDKAVIYEKDFDSVMSKKERVIKQKSNSLF